MDKLRALDRADFHQDLWGLSSRNPTVRSTSDRLRPPYVMPLPYLEPVNAPASRVYEVGFNKLPAAYQALLRTAPPGAPIPTGAMPEGYNYQGIFVPADKQPPEFVDAMKLLRLPLPYSVADSPQTGAHELVHVLVNRHPEVGKKVRTPEIGEALARFVAGEEPDRRTTKWEQQEAADIDPAIRALGGEIPPSMYQRVLQYLGLGGR
jgi:hypothetical protein